MNRIVPSECLSLEEERSLIEALLSRTPFSSSGERLWQIVYPGYSLARFDISPGSTLDLSSLPAIPSARLAAKPARTSKTPPNAPSKKRASSASNGRWCTSTFGACDAIAGVAARSGSPGLIPTAAIHDDSTRKFRLPCAAGAPSRRSAAAST